VATERFCERALEAHEEHLGSLPNVVGLGIVPEGDTGRAARSLAVAVYVTKKLPRDELRPEDIIPSNLEVLYRKRMHQVPVRIVEQGEVELESPGFEGPGLEIPG